MKIQIDGTNTLNKGAELMLYAILEEIEKKHPNATILFNTSLGRSNEIHSNLKIKQSPLLRYGQYGKVILSKLKIQSSLFTDYHYRHKPDLVLDASGYRFGDQWKQMSDHITYIEKYYDKLKRKGAKIVFLPQAFGPFNTPCAKESVKILNKYADLIIARETSSKDNLIKAGGDKSRIFQYPDFTCLTNGIANPKYESIKGKICIIPNKKMITHTDASSEDYLSMLSKVILFIRKKGKDVFLLNHEGEGDLQLCKQINIKFDNTLPIISNLNAKEIKGVIGQSYFVISSRYHGVASALNQSVPCLATSWSHKYEMLFNDFNLKEHIIDIKDQSQLVYNKISSLLSPSSNEQMRNHLNEANITVKINTQKMWELVWEQL